MNDKLEKPGTAIVTGASAGLGRIYADRLSKRGYDLLLVARRSELLDDVAKSIVASYGVKVRTMAADSSSNWLTHSSRPIDFGCQKGLDQDGYSRLILGNYCQFGGRFSRKAAMPSAVSGFARFSTMAAVAFS